MWLTLATFVGYAVVYTVLLKPATPQNIVIGGASGAMPPVLGWAAVTGDVAPEALLLFLIIFVWTPPHFWALALYRRDDYARAGLPMLPVTHGVAVTRGCMIAALHARRWSPSRCCRSSIGMSGLALPGRGARARRRVPRLRGAALPRLQRRAGARTFRFSIVYLPLLFAALLVDHYLGSSRLRALLLAACDRGAEVPGTDITGAAFGRTLELTDHDGKPRPLADFSGKAVVLFFGFTHCPDVCPTTLAELAEAMKKLGPDADRVQVLFVTVDPERDTPEALASTCRPSIRASSGCAATGGDEGRRAARGSAGRRRSRTWRALPACRAPGRRSPSAPARARRPARASSPPARFGQRGRADVRAMGEAEEQHHRLAAEILQACAACRVVGQLERLP